MDSEDVLLINLKLLEHAWASGCVLYTLNGSGRMGGDPGGSRCSIKKMVKVIRCLYLISSILGHLCHKMCGLGLIIVTLGEGLYLVLQALVGKHSDEVACKCWGLDWIHLKRENSCLKKTTDFSPQYYLSDLLIYFILLPCFFLFLFFFPFSVFCFFIGPISLVYTIIII